MGTKVKYMGSADIAILPVGEDFAGRLANPLTSEVRFDWSNKHVVDSEEAGLSPEAVQLLVAEDQEFEDVTDLELVPLNLAQRLWRGLTEPEAQDAPAVAPRAASNLVNDAPSSFVPTVGNVAPVSQSATATE